MNHPSDGDKLTRLQVLPMFLRAPRAGGLWLIGTLIPLATLVGFVLSYHNLLDWALNHGWPVFFAPFFPLLIDLLVITGEVILFVAAIDGKTPWRVRVLAWAVVLGFTILSVAGNVSHAATRDVATGGATGADSGALMARTWRPRSAPASPDAVKLAD